MKHSIICIHIGARSHYLLPKALELNGNLDVLITDTWISSSFVRLLLAKLPLRLVKSLSKRYSDLIPSYRVKSFSLEFIVAEIYIQWKYKNTWQQILARNAIFQRIATSLFKKQLISSCVFGISYTSLQIFKLAKTRGQKTILFQIDAGLKDEKIVSAVIEANKQNYPSGWEAAPPSYWIDWKEECTLSDVIMVNSEWSRRGLIEEGIEANKIKIVPLPFELELKHFQFLRKYPEVYTKDRPLHCLFLGNISLRKGIHLILEVAQSMIEYPIEFTFVGESEINFSKLTSPNINYCGVVTRAETTLYYKQADVFLFPTFSDGFGLTQLEAMAWQLPVIASCYCGEVVKDEFNGLLLKNNKVEELKDMLVRCIHSTYLLPQLSLNCLDTVKKYSLEKFSLDIQSLL